MMDATFNWGRKGRGCSHCEPGVAMSWFKTGSHIVALCMNCLMAWFPGRSVEWLEERLDYYSDHIGFKFAVISAEAKRLNTPPPESFARYPHRDAETGRWTEREKP